MRHSEKQEKIEYAVYRTIDDIAEEFGVKIDSYPEVNWIGRPKEDIPSLGLSRQNQGFLTSLKKMKSSCTFGRKPIIFIVSDNFLDIAEESAHYVHFTASNSKPYLMNAPQQKSLRIICEAIAFLGTKFVIPQRKNVFTKYPDMFFMPPEEKKKTLQLIAKREEPSRVAEYFTYQQAYGLGERIFYDYLRGNTTKTDVTDLVTTHFGKKYDPVFTLLWLKMKYWPPTKGNLK